MKRKGTPAEGGGFQQSSARLTPLDIQEKTFRTARMSGGYHVREVDEFLDQITDVLSALIAENERLRAAVGKDPGAPAEAPAAPAAPVIGAGDRAAVDSFLRREKAFLQGLGGLVQEHAEALREMARSSRLAPSAEAAPERSVQPPPTTEVSDVAEQEAPAHAPPEEIAAPVEEPVAVAGPAEAEPEAPIEVGDDDDVSPSVQEVSPQEEPIRLEETQPARSRGESDPEPSLRELFWGED